MDQTQSAEAYFNAFVRAFATFDAAQVAELFATPGVTLKEDGALVALANESDLRRYYQAALDHYRGRGCRSCRWSDLEVTAMGKASCVAAVTWELLMEDGSTLARWRQSYCLTLAGDGPKAFASATHAA